jgi:hypothetical protein
LILEQHRACDAEFGGDIKSAREDFEAARAERWLQDRAHIVRSVDLNFEAIG